MTRPQLPVDKPLPLPEIGSWPATHHVFDAQSVDAVEMAWAAERPLLLRGEPGTGKSQLARAVAQVGGRAFISEVVNARTEPQDLMWRFDAVSRLGEAQALGRTGEARDALDPRHFLSPGPLWWALDWTSADAQQAVARHPAAAPHAPPGWQPAHGCVLLIDEIDKADTDLPNSLLECLGNRRFAVPWVQQVVGTGVDTPPPLVILTTNEERELPAAFLRRCLVLEYVLPEPLAPWLVERGRVHFGGSCDKAVLDKAAQLLVRDRAEARRAGVTPPGQAEYLDLLRAVVTLRADTDARLALLDTLARYAYRKQRSTAR